MVFFFSSLAVRLLSASRLSYSKRRKPPPSPENDWDSDEEEDGLADQTPLDLSWVPIHTFEIAVCCLPGIRLAGTRRSLVADLVTLKESGIQDVFVLCTDAEMRRCKVHTLLVEYAERNFTPHHYPLHADHLPNMSQCLRLLEDIYSCLQSGRKTAIHCIDGYGRSCVVLTLLAMMLDENLPAASAIEHIRQSRGPAAIQTIKQYHFIMEFHKNLSEFIIQREQIEDSVS